jgi:hypothetical protein
MVVESTDSQEDSENIEEIVMNYNRSSNPMDRLFAVTKVNKLLQGYHKSNFEDPLDVKLVRGLYRRDTEINDFI